jgi:hypothetical protein
MLVVKSVTLVEHKPTKNMRVVVMIVPEHERNLSASRPRERENFGRILPSR